MVLFKLNKAIFFFVLLLLLKCVDCHSQEVINNVGLEKVSAKVYKVKYKLSNSIDYKVCAISLKIFRKRNDVTEEIFSKDITPAQAFKPDMTYAYNWNVDDKTIKDGDALQAKIIVSYNKPEVVKAVELPHNLPPKANAGGNLTIQLPLTLVVILDALRSYDEDGKIVAVKWKQISGPNTLIIASPTSYKSYLAGEFKAGVYTFELSVTDDKGATGTDRMTLTVKPAATVPVKPQINTGTTPGTIKNNNNTVNKKIFDASLAPALKGGPSNALVDLLLPGLGHYFVSGDYLGNDRKPAVLLISALYAGSVGGAVYYKLRSNSQYNKYIDLSNFREYQKDDNGNIIGVRGANQAQATQYLNDARNSQHNFLILTGISAGIMAADIVYTFIRGAKNKKAWKSEYSAKTNLFISSNGTNFIAGIRVKL